jgi:hypothetical protein
MTPKDTGIPPFHQIQRSLQGGPQCRSGGAGLVLGWRGIAAELTGAARATVRCGGGDQYSGMASAVGCNGLPSAARPWLRTLCASLPVRQVSQRNSF